MSAVGFGALNLPNTSVYNGGSTPDDKTVQQLLASIDNHLARLDNEYVTQPLFKIFPVKNLAAGAQTDVMLCDNVPVGRVLVQVFTVSGLVSLFFSSAQVGPNDIPHFQIGPNPFPTTITVPNVPKDLVARNDGTVPVSFTVILSAASG